MSSEEAAACVVHYRRIFYESIDELTPDLFDGVKNTLARLYAMGLKLSIASSRSSPSLLLFMRNMAIDDYFSYVLGSDSVERHKPDPEPVLKTLRDLGFEPSETIVVGDMPVDILMARNAGVRAVGVSWGNATRKELIESKADVVIDKIDELLRYVE